MSWSSALKPLSERQSALTTEKRPRARAALLVNRLIGVREAEQVVAIIADGYGDTTATLTTYERGSHGWTQVVGPFTAEIGQAGFAHPGGKHEGDLTTPSGSFGFGFFFGIDSDPGVRFPWRAVTPDDFWDGDPTSSLCNQWVDSALSGAASAGADPEPMQDAPFYDYGAVIDYNTDPVVSGAGSAIFLHVSDGQPTTGCVSLPASELLPILRWLDPASSPRIIMGTESAVVS